ncbi:MAG: alpha/beta fold hydrolase [Phycisphaerales bacterium]|nr:alpha/beta fold hydrolase [Phycisphaerales bacterium]
MNAGKRLDLVTVCALTAMLGAHGVAQPLLACQAPQAATAQNSANEPTSKPASNQDAIRLAREAFAMLNEGRHKEFIERCSVQMGAALTEAQSMQLRAMLAMRLGAFQNEISAEATTKGTYESVMLQQKYFKGIAKLEIVIDSNQKVAGLWIRDLQSTTAAELPPYAKPDSYADEDVLVITGKFELPGTLTLPKGTDKAPAVVLVHGSGPHDRDETIVDNKPFRDLAVGLASRGIAVLRYEKRTHKYAAEIKATEIGLDEETSDDALSAVSLLRGRAEVDPRRIFVLGHSLGGMAAPFIAQRDPAIAGIVLLAGTPRPLLDVVEEQIDYIAKLDDVVSEEEGKQLDELRATKAKIRAGDSDISKDSLLGAPAAYWKKIDALRPGEVAAKLMCRILVIQAGRDYQVDGKSFDGWKAALGDRKNVKYRVFEKLSHLMIAGEGKPSPMDYQKKGFVDIEVLDEIAGWIQKG